MDEKATMRIAATELSIEGDASFENKSDLDDVQEENLNTETSEKKEEKLPKEMERNLGCDLVKKIYPSDLRKWPILDLLKPEFIPNIRIVMVYDNGNQVLIVTKHKIVYNLDYDTDFSPKKIQELCGKNIKTFAHGSNFILALTEEGEVYSWDFKKTSNETIAAAPTRVFGLSEIHIIDIACGNKHSLALSSDGKVYAWGNNEFGQVGNESKSIFDNNVPRQVKYNLEKKHVIHIACGSEFNMVLTDENKLYGWGDNKSYQISMDITPATISNTSNSFRTSTEGLFPIPLCTTTSFSSFTTTTTTTTTNSSFESFGSNNSPVMFGKSSSKFSNVKPNFNFSQNDTKSVFGQTDSNITAKNYLSYPFEINKIPDKIVKVTCGYNNTVVLTDKGQVHTWGFYNNTKISDMVTMSNMGKVVDIAAHGCLNVAVNDNGTVYVWGNCWGRNITTPKPTELSRIHDAFAYSSLRVMHKPLILSMGDYEYVEELMKILNSIRAAFDDSSTSDLILQVEGKSIHVHKAILQIRWKDFKTKFQRDWVEINQSTPGSTVYTVSDKFSYIIYKAFLKYLYTGMIDLPSEKALGEFESNINPHYKLTASNLKQELIAELLKLADDYCESTLKRDCCHVIKQEVTTSNVAFFYNKAIQCNAKELEEFCFQFALCHMKVVVLSDAYQKLDKSIQCRFILEATKKDAFRT